MDTPLGHATEFPAFTPAERESFFASIARHRGAASRVSWVAGACATILAVVVAVLMAPLLYAFIGLALDLMNLVVPMPDVLRSATETVAALTDHPETVSSGRWIYFGLVAALPGLAMMALAWRTLGHVVRDVMGCDAVDLAARAINPEDLAEQRFANVVSEMAIAAGLGAPRVLVTDNASVNAAAFGVDRSHASIVITTGLLAEVDRSELQGVAAHLVGSIANGDMRIGARFALVLGMFGLIAKLSSSFADREAARRFFALLRGSLKSGRGATDRQSGRGATDGQLVMELTNPFEPEPSASADAPERSDKIPWRTIAWMPLAGPLVISGFFGGLLCAFLLGPLLSLTWRRRKYLADATAVQLTRDPDTLGRALEKMRGAPVEGAFGAWIAHMCVVPNGLIGAKSILGGSSVPMSPSLDKRLKALGVMGARVTPRAGRVVPPLTWLIVAPLIAIVAVLMCGVVVGLLFVSAATSALFTWLPALLLHALLR
jgi:Zn-dependent protease with chaperone function